MELDKDFREFIELLNAQGVNYLVVGGYAVNYYGYLDLQKI
jgi:2-hydroxy-3-keto-5-methylthiopentenyl-1-phosphate phosphatase